MKGLDEPFHTDFLFFLELQSLGVSEVTVGHTSVSDGCCPQLLEDKSDLHSETARKVRQLPDSSASVTSSCLFSDWFPLVPLPGCFQK